jgi:N-acetylglucosamine-6-phosphate deacetylase
MSDPAPTGWEVCARLPEGGVARLKVSGSRLVAVEPIPGNPEKLPYALPVLVDLQHNGALGMAYNMLEQAADAPARLMAVADHLRRHGVGRCLLTLTTYPHEGLKRTAVLVNEALSRDAGLTALFFGLFHEGVYISPQDGWRGAHAAQWVKPPDYEAFREVDDCSGGRIKVVNVAPEEPGGLAFIERACADGKRVALGHACPSAAVVREAVARGATFVTHFGNGAAPMMHRFKNPFWAFLDEPALSLGVICDGFHLPPEVVRVALRCKGRAGCLPVSDASGHSGMPPGAYEGFGGRRFVIEPSGFMHVAESEILSGGWFQADRCVEFLVQAVGLPFLEAWEQCSVIPARAIGLELPRIAAGQEASFILARWENGLVLDQAVHLGRRFLEAPLRPGMPSAGHPVG